MARYIDVDKLLTQKPFTVSGGNPSDYLEGYLDCVDEAKETINNSPTADVVEVVRCKDCDVPHNKWLGCPNLNGLIPPPDFYCAKGTPKEKGVDE